MNYVHKIKPIHIQNLKLLRELGKIKLVNNNIIIRTMRNKKTKGIIVIHIRCERMVKKLKTVQY